MLRRTSKKIKEVVDKMRLPAVVRLSRSFWDDARNGTEKEKRHFVLRQVTLMTAPHHRITTMPPAFHVDHPGLSRLSMRY